MHRVVRPETDYGQNAEEEHNPDNPEPECSFGARVCISIPSVSVPNAHQEADFVNHYTKERDADKDSMNSSVYVEKEER
jgi:hypothetical protein